MLFTLVSANARAQETAAPPLSAQEDPATIAAARALAIEGVKLVQAGRCDEAIDKLERAEALHHAPIVLQNLGACQVEQGRLVEGTEALRRVLREPLPAKPSPALRRAYERAQQILDRTKPSIASLTIAIALGGEPAVADRATVTVDGQRVPAALLDAERPTDPGEHTLDASAPGYAPAHATIALAPGEKQRVALSLERDASAAVTVAAPEPGSTSPSDVAVATLAPASTARAARAADTAAARTPSHAAAYVTWAAGAVGLAIGTGFGIAALARTDSLRSQCDGNVCSERARGRLDTARQFGTISTIGFASGLAAGVLGAVLYWNASSGSERAPAAQARIGLGGAELRAAF
jgi:hypothetical protein